VTDGVTEFEMVDYVLACDDRVYAISCGDLAAPPDRWLSFAETFECLSEAE
jgi:hypothetical protein